jgi:hypothetical protein
MTLDIFKIKTNREKFLAYSMIPIVIFFLSYNFLHGFLDTKNSELLQQKEILSSQLKIKQDYLASVIDQNLNNTIKKYTDNILLLEQSINNEKELKNKLLSDIKELNNQSLKWVTIVEFLVKESNNKSIEISNIKNVEITNSSENTKEKLNIQVTGIGQFKNIYSFINDIEKFNNMLLVDNITIDKSVGNELNFKFNIKIWEFNL